MVRGENIPIDLVMEILSRLPARSIARCRCVSKKWGTMLLRPYFTDLFRSRTSDRPPLLLFSVQRADGCSLMSLQPQSFAATDFHMKFPGSDSTLEFGGHASGFIHVLQMSVKDGPGICNPSTGQYMSLPLSPFDNGMTFLGFDPIDKQLKVLAFDEPYYDVDYNFVVYGEGAQILTLGTGNDSWRKIYCPLNHFPYFDDEGKCINGVLYYLAQEAEGNNTMIVCFDVRYEKFKFIHKVFDKNHTKLVNYKGSLGMIMWDYGASPSRLSCLNLRMSVIKDVENREWEWSQHFSFCWDDEIVEKICFSIAGVTATGEIVLSKIFVSEPFQIIYINLERKTVQSVEIQGLRPNGFRNHGRVKFFVDYVEDLKLIPMMKTTTSK